MCLTGRIRSIIDQVLPGQPEVRGVDHEPLIAECLASIDLMMAISFLIDENHEAKTMKAMTRRQFGVMCAAGMAGMIASGMARAQQSSRMVGLHGSLPAALARRSAPPRCRYGHVRGSTGRGEDPSLGRFQFRGQGHGRTVPRRRRPRLRDEPGACMVSPLRDCNFSRLLCLASDPG